MHRSISSIYFLLVLSVVSLVMNKILPILLVVMLSGCSSFSDEYICTSQNNYTTYLAISDKEMLFEDPVTNVYEIYKETDTKIRAKLDSIDNILVFHKKLLTLTKKVVLPMNKTSRRYTDFFYKCKHLSD